MSKELISCQDAARLADRDVQTVYRWLRDGRLTRYKSGPGRGFTKVDLAELEELIKPFPVVVSTDH